MNTFTKTYLIEFPLKQVYACWLSTDAVILPAAKLEIDPEVGGVYRIFIPGGSIMDGMFIRVSENKALTYTWQWHGSDEETEVDVQFTEHAVGTEVQITHGEFLSEQSMCEHAQGWDNYIQGFSDYLESV